MVDSQEVGEQAPRGDEVMMIADALRAKFGEGAVVVAQLQIADSDLGSRATWESVLTELSR